MDSRIKITNKKERKHARCEKRREKYKVHVSEIKDIMQEFGLTKTQASRLIRNNYINIDGRDKQICSYYSGLCDSPCNGDC